MKFLINLFLFMLLLNTSLLSKDIIKLAKSSSSIDYRFKYPEHILKLSLDASMDKYGPYEIINTNLKAKRNRMLLELNKGLKINVHSAPTRPEWEEQSIPILFPIMKGLLNYRIFLIHKDNQTKFKELETIDDLKKLTAGLGSQWSTTKALRIDGGFNIKTNNNYEGLFGMLARKRFDYFIRGVNEVFGEYDERKEKYPEIFIEQHVVMELPLPWFFFVSPKNKRIAERIKYGLEKMKKDGSFDREFNKYYSQVIKKANIYNRKIFRVKNMLLKPNKIYDDPSYWIDISKYKQED